MASWSQGQHTEELSYGDQELKMIPKWAMILAIVAFLGMQYLTYGNIFASNAQQKPAAVTDNQKPAVATDNQRPPAGTDTQRPANAPNNRRPHWPYRLIGSYLWGTAAASYILMLGYVSRDAKRRDMSVSMWMLVSVVLPGGLGAVVYFLLRQPIMTRCPNCVTPIAAGYHFCPQCQFQVAPVCGVCHRSVKITDVYCTQCGHDLAEDHAPSRLRVYSD